MLLLLRQASLAVHTQQLLLQWVSQAMLLHPHHCPAAASPSPSLWLCWSPGWPACHCTTQLAATAGVCTASSQLGVPLLLLLLQDQQVRLVGRLARLPVLHVHLSAAVTILLQHTLHRPCVWCVSRLQRGMCTGHEAEGWGDGVRRGEGDAVAAYTAYLPAAALLAPQTFPVRCSAP
jgi:hypothetical protein